jgi:hypothetical protein
MIAVHLVLSKRDLNRTTEHGDIGTEIVDGRHSLGVALVAPDPHMALGFDLMDLGLVVRLLRA